MTVLIVFSKERANFTGVLGWEKIIIQFILCQNLSGITSYDVDENEGIALPFNSKGKLHCLS